MEKFTLSEDFLSQYVGEEPDWGFGGLSKFTYMRTYSRVLWDEGGRKEAFWETLARVVNGTFNLQKKHIKKRGLGWDPDKAQASAQEMYRRCWTFRMTPPGRGLWAMGSRLTEELGLFAPLNNCGFVSTKRLGTGKKASTKPFRWAMDMLMLGVGVGFDVRGADELFVDGVRPSNERRTFVVPDSREGWVKSLGALLEAWMFGGAPIQFDYSRIRSAGEPIKGFGGTSSGPAPLKELHSDIRAFMDRNAGAPITTRTIVDIMNVIGKCVIAGNVRRSAEIAIGDPRDTEFLDLKDYDKNPDRASHGWASNNSIFARLGMNYGIPATRTAQNGEPGYIWMQNTRANGRMFDNTFGQRADKASGFNPCVEQPLESYELCCLVETYPHHHESKEDFLRTLKYAYMYGKTVTLGKTHWPETNRVMLRNRRIGTSVTGVTQFIADRGLGTLRDWLRDGYERIQWYDDTYSEWLCVPQSIRTTTVKPSGTVSLLCGATPGMHWPEANTYIRRVEVQEDSDMIPALEDAGYPIEPSVYKDDAYVVEFPVRLDENMRTSEEVSMWEQLSLAAFLQREWSDNSVSATIKFDPEQLAPGSDELTSEETRLRAAQEVRHALDYFQYQLKAVSFLPTASDDAAYEQMPYEPISRDEYERRVKNLGPIDFSGVTGEQAQPEKYCTSESCQIS